MPPTPDDIARARREALAPFCAADVVAMDAASYERLLAHPEALAASYGEDDDTDAAPYEIRGGVAVVPVRGALSQRGGRFWMWSWAGYDTVSAALSAALADPSARSVVLDIDSPGGAVAGMLDAARAMRAAVVASGKPCVAVASEMACSAAYALACVADEIVVPETGCVGSVGVIGTMTSLARLYAAAGADVRVIASGAAKGDGHPALPIAPAALERAQERVDALAAAFAGWVAERRGTTPDAVLALDARVYGGAAAVAAGLADRVASSTDTLAALQRRTDSPRPLGASPQRSIMHPVLAALGVTTDAEGLQSATALLSLRAQLHAATGTTDDAAALGALHAMKRDAASAADLRAQIETDRKAAAAAERAAILDRAVDAMQLTPAERAADGTAEGWTTALDNAALRAFAARAGTVAPRRQAAPAPVTPSASALTDEQRSIADQLGISHDDYAKALAAQG